VLLIDKVDIGEKEREKAPAPLPPPRRLQFIYN